MLSVQGRKMLRAGIRATGAAAPFAAGRTESSLHELDRPRRWRDRRGEEVCVRCPVRKACLRFALTTRQDDGIWGGLTEGERRILRRRQ